MNDRVFKHRGTQARRSRTIEWLPPAEIVAHLRLGPGMKMADIGAGTGYFSIPIARAVGALGHVFAVDLQPEMLDLLRGKLEQPNAPDNVSLHQGLASQVPLPDRNVRMILYANIWHEIEDLDSTFREAVRISVLGGKIAILDWRDDCSPPPGSPQEHRISNGSVMTFLNAKGCGNLVSKHVGQFGYLVTAELNSAQR